MGLKGLIRISGLGLSVSDSRDPYMGVSENKGYLILGVPIIRILRFRVLY